MKRITFSLLDNLRANGRAMQVLDAGCGTGGMLEPLGRLGSVVGLDFSPLATQLSSTRQSGAVLRGSIGELPFPEATFDLVTCFDVIYHLAVRDDETALKEFCRVLRPGGHALVRVPAYDSLRGKHDVEVHTRHRYTLAELTAKFRRAGLKPINATYANTVLFPVASAKRLWDTLSASQPKAESDLKPVPEMVSATLLGILTFESWLIKRISLPFGLSAICLAIKQE